MQPNDPNSSAPGVNPADSAAAPSESNPATNAGTPPVVPGGVSGTVPQPEAMFNPVYPPAAPQPGEGDMVSPSGAVTPASTPAVTAEPTPAAQPTTPTGAGVVQPQSWQNGYAPEASVGYGQPQQPVMGGVPNPPKKTNIKGMVMKITLAFVALLVLGFGSVEAYINLVVYKRPDIMVLRAVANTLQQNQLGANATVKVFPASGGDTPLYTVTVNAAGDATKQTAQGTLTLDVQGTKLTVEGRYTGEKVYFKLGEVNSIIALAQSQFAAMGMPADASLTQLAQAVSAQVSDKWFVIDTKSDSKEGGSCYANIKWMLTDADIKVLMNAYKKNMFVTGQKQGSETVNGEAATKISVTIDNDKAVDFGTAVGKDGLSLIKQINDCNKSSNSTSSSSAPSKDHKKTPMTFWVDGHNRVAQLEIASTPEMVKEDNMKVDAKVAFDYKPVNVTVPADVHSTEELQTALYTAFNGDPNAIFGVVSIFYYLLDPSAMDMSSMQSGMAPSTNAVTSALGGGGSTSPKAMTTPNTTTSAPAIFKLFKP